jgi:radical SAM superfamily enzyme YgiQ (UPF0313 family)
MNVLIISTNRSVFPAPVLPFGACLVAEAAERAGHRVTLLDLMFERRPVSAVESAVRNAKPDVVGLSVRNIDNNDMHSTSFYINELSPLFAAVRAHSEARIVLGGAALGVMPEQILRAADADCAVVGEGESTFCRLLARIEDKQPYHDVPGVATIDRGTFKASPETRRECLVPDYRRWLGLSGYRSRMCTIPLQTKLGCRFQCVYCTYRKIEGEAYRLFDPGSVAETALRLTSAGLRDIEFVDNVFNAPEEHAIELCDSFIRSRVRARFQSVELNPAYFSRDLVAVMEKAGFAGIGMTVESASDNVLRGLRKGFSARDVFRAAETLRGSRIPCIWIFMLGGPGETQKTVRETVRFAERNIRPGDAAFFNIGVRIYPGTELELIARRQGVLTVPGDRMLAPVFYVSPDVGASWMRKQVQDLLNRHMNFMSIDSFRFPHLPLLHKIGYRMGVRSPLWRYTRFIRRTLRLIGMSA